MYYYSTEAVVWKGSGKKDVLRNSVRFTGKRLCWSFFFNEVAGNLQLYYKRDSSTSVPVNLVKFLKTPILKN